MTNKPYWEQSDDYREGWRRGRQEATDMNVRWQVVQIANAPMNRKTPVKTIKSVVPSGLLNVEAIHRQSHKRKPAKLRYDVELKIVDAGDNTGVAVFEIRVTWLSPDPIITGVYTYDHTDPRARPLLKMWQADLKYLRWIRVRRLITDFAESNGSRIWWHKDRTHDTYLMVKAGVGSDWWGGKKAHENHKKYRYFIRYLRSHDLITRYSSGRAIDATLVYNPEKNEWVKG